MITLRSASWWILVAALSLCLFAVAMVVFPDALQTVYLRQTAAPRLKREFGFDSDYVRSTFTITRITPDGVLAKAGVRVGDRPWDYHGRDEMSFYYMLQAARSRRVVLRVRREPPGSGIVEIPVSLRAEIPR